MNEQPDNIESRLGRLQLRPISASLQQRIARDLEKPAQSPRADRWLWSAITSGAIAACIIVATLMADTPSRSAPALPPMAQRSQPSHVSGSALASADHRWGDELTSAMSWSQP